MKTTLKEFIKNVINEAYDEEYKTGAELDIREKDAKEAALAAVDALNLWDENEKKKRALEARAREEGVSFDTAKKRYGRDPDYAYDPRLSLKKRKTFEDAVNKTREEYLRYEPDIKAVSKKKGGARTGDLATVYPEPDAKAIIAISSVDPLTWYRWPAAVKKSGKSYGSKAAGAEDEAASSGVGPGEDWLGYIFGGTVQGGGVSYDVVTPDKRKWEVKQLLSASETIRPGTEGLKAYASSRERLDEIMNQMKKFVEIAKNPQFDDAFDEDERFLVNFVDAFVEDEYEMIVSKGELSRDRIIRLRGVLKKLSEVKGQVDQGGKKKKPTRTQVGLNDKKINVDKSTFIDIANKVEKATGDRNVLNNFDAVELLFAELKDDAFMKPSDFLNEWYDSIDINEVFSQVDGVFIVNPAGYLMIPSESFKSAFHFSKVTQGKPRFALKVAFGP